MRLCVSFSLCYSCGLGGYGFHSCGTWNGPGGRSTQRRSNSTRREYTISACLNTVRVAGLHSRGHSYNWG